MKHEKFGRRELTGDELEKGNLPGTDTYDDGLEPSGLKMAGSTSTESAGNYMEHKGPNDLVHRAGNQNPSLEELDPEVTVSDVLGANDNLIDSEIRGDEADKWLQENDPEYPKYGT